MDPQVRCRAVCRHSGAPPLDGQGPGGLSACASECNQALGWPSARVRSLKTSSVRPIAEAVSNSVAGSGTTYDSGTIPVVSVLSRTTDAASGPPGRSKKAPPLFTT